jgi:hypothetical protein
MALNPFSPSRVTTEEAQKFISRRQQPISTVRLQTTATVLFTTPASFDFLVRHLWAANIDGSARTITIYLVPDGQVPGDGNAICKAYSIAANTTVRLDFISGTGIGSLLQPGMTLQALASTNDTVNMGGWGQEIAGDLV